MITISTLCIQAQDNSHTSLAEVDVIEIGTPSSSTYHHINFPKTNFIIKRGGIVDYKKIRGNKN